MTSLVKKLQEKKDKFHKVKCALETEIRRRDPDALKRDLKSRLEDNKFKQFRLNFERNLSQKATNVVELTTNQLQRR